MTRPRELHPMAWWLWAIGIAAAASNTTNPWLLGLLAAVTCLVVFACRGDGTWSRSFRLYLWLAAITVVVRVLSRIVFGAVQTGHVVFTLPEIPLPDLAAGIQLLGPVTREALLSGLYDGLQLGLIMLAFGAANALANPKRLLKNLPPSLYEIGSALVVAVSVLPQLADSARRVKHAQQLRGGATGRIAGLRRLLVPVLEDAFDRSLALAAGMDARGYGRTGSATPGQRRLTGLLMLTALAGVVVGVYGFLDRTAPRWLGVPMLAVGALCAVLGMWSAGRRVERTRYRPDAWHLPEVLVAASGLLSAAGVIWCGHRSLAIAHPGLTSVPSLDLLGLLAPLVALLPLLVAPPAPTAMNRTADQPAGRGAGQNVGTRGSTPTGTTPADLEEMRA